MGWGLPDKKLPKTLHFSVFNPRTIFQHIRACNKSNQNSKLLSETPHNDPKTKLSIQTIRIKISNGMLIST